MKKIPFLKINGGLRFRESKIERWLEMNEQGLDLESLESQINQIGVRR